MHDLRRLDMDDQFCFALFTASRRVVYADVARSSEPSAVSGEAWSLQWGTSATRVPCSGHGEWL